MDRCTAKELDRFLDSVWAMAFDIRLKVRVGAVMAVLAILTVSAAVVIVVCCDLMPAARMETLSMTAYVIAALFCIALLSLLAVIGRTASMMCSNLRTMIFRTWPEAERMKADGEDRTITNHTK